MSEIDDYQRSVRRIAVELEVKLEAARKSATADDAVFAAKVAEFRAEVEHYAMKVRDVGLDQDDKKKPASKERAGRNVPNTIPRSIEGD